jgi:dienelactone hydrolase
MTAEAALRKSYRQGGRAGKEAARGEGQVRVPPLQGEARVRQRDSDERKLPPLEYNPQAAELAWKRTMEFLDRHLNK